MHALSFVRDEEEAKDIVTDVYEYVWRNFNKLDVSVSLRPLLYKLTRSRSLDFLRREKSKEKFLAYQATLSAEEEEYKDQEELIGKVMKVIESMRGRRLPCSGNVLSRGKNINRQRMN